MPYLEPEKPKKKKKSTSSRDIALDKLDFYTPPKPKGKKEDKIKGRPKNIFVRFAEAAFPQRDDSAMEKARKIILIFAIAIFAGTLIFLLSQLKGIQEGQNINSEIAEIAGSPIATMDIDMSYQPFSTFGQSVEVIDETEEINVTPVVNTPLSIDFDALKAVNPDTKAWIKITGTPLNNVIVGTDNDDYYLDHDFYGNESISGTIFSSRRNKWDGTDENIILYGHNMISGDFFGYLGHYVPKDYSKEPCAFYKVHPTLMIATPDGGSETYKIFAGMLVNTQSQYGEVFKYTNKTKFRDKDDFNNFVLEIMDRSWFFTDVDLTYGDQLVTLSTCLWPLGKDVDTRWVVFARKVRPGESEYVDVSKAQRNYYAKLFDYYYDLIGTQWYGSTWDRSKLLSY